MKILIVSHTPLSSYEAMGKTISAFFSSFDKEEVSQLYIYPSYPDVNVCHSYYRVTDIDVLKGYFNFNSYGGVVEPKQQSSKVSIYDDDKVEEIYKNHRNKKAFIKLLRDVMWKFSRWYNRSLKKWLDYVNPDCIFLCPGGAKFIYDMALKISRKRNIPIITYIADEHYFLDARKYSLEWVKQKLLCRTMKKTFEASSCLITICDELRDAYIKEFHRETHTIMTGSSIEITNEKKSWSEIHKVSYFGKMSLNRYLSLIGIARMLDIVNRRHESSIRLNIYSNETNEKIVNAFANTESVIFHDFIAGEKFKQEFKSSDVLVHVESFDNENADKVKHSVSTKIADSLASGIPLLAYGPRGISSIEHLVRNNCALVASSCSELEILVEKMAKNEINYIEVQKNAIETAKRFHDQKKNSSFFREVCNQTIEIAGCK